MTPRTSPREFFCYSTQHVQFDTVKRNVNNCLYHFLLPWGQPTTGSPVVDVNVKTLPNVGVNFRHRGHRCENCCIALFFDLEVELEVRVSPLKQSLNQFYSWNTHITHTHTHRIKRSEVGHTHTNTHTHTHTHTHTGSVCPSNREPLCVGPRPKIGVAPRAPWIRCRFPFLLSTPPAKATTEENGGPRGDTADNVLEQEHQSRLCALHAIQPCWPKLPENETRGGDKFSGSFLGSSSHLHKLHFHGPVERRERHGTTAKQEGYAYREAVVPPHQLG